MRLQGVVVWVGDEAQACTFYQRALGLVCQDPSVTLPDGVTIHLEPGRVRCSARGPHGVVPALEVADIAAAKGWLQSLQRPIVFEEVVPGLARFTFLDPDGNPVDLVMPLATDRWARGQSIPVADAGGPPEVRGLFEVSVYVRDLRSAVRFYRDGLGLETGLTYFAHLHLLFENTALVLRPTWVRCSHRASHTPALVVDGPFRCPDEVGKSKVVDLHHLDPDKACWDGEHTWVLWPGK